MPRLPAADPDMIPSILEDPARQELLRALDLLRPHRDASFDHVTRIAALATGCPIALLTFVGTEGQWIASGIGWPSEFDPLHHSFCVHALTGTALMEVPDATADARFANNELVTGERRVRSYAGHPVTFEGHVLGTVCVIDHVPRRTTAEQARVLGDLAALVTDLLRARHERAMVDKERSVAIELRQALEGSEERYRLLWQSTADAVVLVDDQDTIRFANPAVRTLFDREPETLVGQPLSVLQPERLRNAHIHGFERYLRTGQKRLNWRSTETSALRRDGTEVPVEIAFSEMTSQGRRMFGAFIRDITDRRRAETARRDLEGQLRESQKLEAIGVLAGGIAHDFNNIIAGVLGNAQLALEDVGSPHAATQSLLQIRRAGLRARQMVQQILTFARRQPKRPSHCDVHGLVDETLSLLRATLPAAVSLSTDLPSRPLRVFADPNQVEQALINLCTNAWQAMAGGPGSIVIGAVDVDLTAAEAERVGPVPPGPYISIHVTDDGPGMDEATRARVFEPFFTTKPEGEGTGLGLAVVHGIATGHGGAVTAESALGHGTTFRVWLPADRSGEVDDPAPAQPAVPMGGGLRVLYVDDDEVMSELVPRLLERWGYNARALPNALEALSVLRAAPAAFDAVVTDLNMPRMSGVDLAREIQRLRPDLPVVLGSGNLPAEVTLGGDLSAIRAAYHKQNTIEELPALLGRILQRR